MSQLDLDELDHSPVANSTNERASLDMSSPASCLLIPDSSTLFTCPGESHPISRSIHLARLSSFYAKCRECPHRGDTGPLLPHIAEQLPIVHRRETRHSLLATDGVRGVYLNELDRTRAAEWGAALASMLWDEQPRFGRGSADTDEREKEKDELVLVMDSSPSPPLSPSPSTRHGPTVVIGFDERPSSPDIVTGAALGLRRMGCQVIDLGQTTAPCFQFTVQHLNAAAGLLVTGAGCDPAWTGFDVLGRSARPWSIGDKLEELEELAKVGVMRPTRAAGSQRTFQALVPYEAGLWKHFHALRPLQVVCGSATRLFPQVLERLFAKLPCRLNQVRLPMRQRSVCDGDDVDVQRVASAVVSGGQHLGLIVDDDGQHCAFVTERGRLVSPGELARLLIAFELREHRSAKVVLTEKLSDELSGWLTARGATSSLAAGTAARMTASLSEDEAPLGLTDDGRVWFGESHPTCDAILTLARVLQALSLTDASFSEVMSRIGRA